jgi:hypothetical protein
MTDHDTKEMGMHEALLATPLTARQALEGVMSTYTDLISEHLVDRGEAPLDKAELTAFNELPREEAKRVVMAILFDGMPRDAFT